MYYWTHSQASPTVQDVNRLTPMWPPTQAESPDNKPGLKYTEADHQAAMVELRHQYNEEVDKLQLEHRGVLDRARQEYETRLQQAVEKIALLNKEVEKYKCLAGIEKLTQAALQDADAAQVEAGLLEGHHLHSPDRGSGDHHAGPHSPNEMFNDMSAPSELHLDGVEDSSVPPPPPPPPPGFSEGGAAPPPAPPPFGSAVHRRESLKPVINPRHPMKPLFWQRIQVHEVKIPRLKEYYESHLIWEEVKEEDVNVTELDELFSKSVTEPSRRFSPLKHKAKVKQVAKVIAPKRSQTIGILLSSLRMDMSDIEHAILQFDTSILNEEKLRQIYENRGSDEEVKKIKEHLKKHPDVCLDKPDQFLYDLSLIPDYAERIFCFIFQQAFQESISVIESKMTNIRMTCQSLLTSVHIKKILGLVLALGNYMNGGNRNRGQADGFGIDILPKLKDVKSRDNSSSLLHYTVIQYIRKFEADDAGTDRVRLPLPDPSDMKQATQVHFDELEKELHRINKDFEAAEQRADKVICSAMMQSAGHLQPFKDTMTMFFEKGRHEFQEQEENLAEGKKMFAETVITFCMKPKHGEKVVTPEYFFSLWTTFCQDFKDMWKREQQKIVKLRIKDNELRVRKIQEGLTKKPVRTRTRQRGGLKDRLAKQGLLQS